MSTVTYSLLNALPSGGVWDISTNYLKSDYFKLGINAGSSNQETSAIAIGYQAGQNYQSVDSIAIGNNSGLFNQRGYSVAIGSQAGQSNQGSWAIAIGYQAGNQGQQYNSVAIGNQSGLTGQGTTSVAIGYQAGQYYQSSTSIAIGSNAAQNSQGYGALAIGYNSGNTGQGAGSIAIGVQAGSTDQHQGSIVINASSDLSSYLNSATQNACYINPIRQSGSALNTLGYNATTKEIVYQGNPITEALNFSNYGQTTKLLSINYNDNTVVKTNGINANLDSYIDNTQIYTFGPNLQARFVIATTNSGSSPYYTSAYSTDGLTWVRTAPQTFGGTATSNSYGIAYNGNVWVMGGSTGVAGPSFTASIASTGVMTVTVAGASSILPGMLLAGGSILANTYVISQLTGTFGSTGTYNVSIPQTLASTALTGASSAMAYSYDGNIWNPGFGFNSTASTTICACYGVSWGGNKFIACGTNGSATVPNIVYYSYDGINWTSGSGITTGAGGNARLAAFNGSRWIMVGAIATTTPSATGWYSADGITWTATTTNIFTATTSACGFGVAWNGYRWVAVGTSSVNAATTTNTINYSTDGLTWTASTNGTTFNSTTAGVSGIAYGVVWNGVRFVVVGQDATTTTRNIVYSLDGVNWSTAYTAGATANTNIIFAAGQARSVCWNGYKFIAGGNISPYVAYSFDGISWILAPTTGTPSPFVFNIAYNSVRPQSITFPRNIVVAGGSYNAAGVTTLAYSLDNGLTWVACTNAIFGTTAGTSFCYCMATNGNIWVAGGAGSTTLGYSFNGIVWTAVPNATNIFSTNVKGIAWSPVLKLWVAVGSGTNQLAYSYDGITWTGVTLPSGGFSSSLGFDVAWGEDKFVACGGANNANTQKFYYSYDGINWTLVNSITFLFGAYGIGFNGTMWVAVGYGNGSTAYSYDGIIWLIGSGSTFSNNDFNGNGAVAWSGYRWVVTSGTATATATTTPILYSNDGINWSAAASPASMGGCGMVWAGNRFISGMSVSAAAAQIYTSPDGVTWTVNVSNTFGLQCNCLAWSSNLPNSSIQNVNVAIQQPTLAFGSGTNTIAYSYDGISWRGLGSSVFTSTGYCGCWNGTIWVAGGVSSGFVVLAYSYDGINWTISSQSILTTIVWSVAWNGTLFVAVGGGASSPIAYSYDGIFWQTSASASAVGFTTAYCVAWGQNYFVVGSGGSGTTNNMAYSTDGITWTGYTLVTSTTYKIRGIICGQSLWVLVGQNSSNNSMSYWATNPTAGANWTAGTGVPTNTSAYALCISYGIYPVSSSAAGTTYGSIFCLGGGFPQAPTAGSILAYSTDGKAWTTSSSATTIFNATAVSSLNSITWNGKRFIAAGGTNTVVGLTGASKMAYSYDAQTWYSVSSVTNVVTPSQLFTTSIYGLASSAWPTLGSTYLDNTLTISKNSGLNTTQQLDVYSDTYFNNGYNNAAITIESNSYQLINNL